MHVFAVNYAMMQINNETFVYLQNYAGSSQPPGTADVLWVWYNKKTLLVKSTEDIARLADGHSTIFSAET
jgi:hypothetical protein